jgi:molybdate transport system regulatory protein
MKRLSPTLKVRLWLETEDGMILGMGRARLLDEVARHGSLNKAAKELGMSYRAAWGRLKKTESLLGEPLVEKGGVRQGFVLTPLGRELVDRFRAWHDDVERYALARAAEAFPWAVHGYAGPVPAAAPEDAHP